MVTTLKIIHICCAYLTGAGFLFRGWLALSNHPLRQHRLVHTVPHIIDSALLFSALAMVHLWSIQLSHNPWLVAKIFVLFMYIACGLLMLRFGSTQRRRWIGLIGGLLCYGQIIAIAHTKSVSGLLSL